MFDTGPGQGMRCDGAPILKVCEQQGCRPTTHDAQITGTDEMNEMSREK